MMSKEEKKSETQTKADNFGIIFHYGPYSVPCFDDPDSAKRRKTQNGSEWYFKRLTETGNFRGISGYKETQAYHEKHHSSKTYQDFMKEFTSQIEKVDIDSWMDLCKNIGAKYVLLTSKHHDGYCLWPTKTARSSRRDFIKDFKLSAEKHGLKFGLYYSWTEFDKTATKDYLNNIVSKQISELLEYKPQIWWFDGDWNCKTKYALKFMRETVRSIKSKISHVEINDRIGLSKTEKEDINKIEDCTYRVYSDRAIPQTKPNVKWEHINTIGFSWGRNKQQEEKHYKSAEDLVCLFNKVKELGGNFLLNLGPDADGSLDKFEVDRLVSFAKLIV